MTAEAVVMNRTAVALAADSAVTIGDGLKTRLNGRKLFDLGDRPVALMVLGRADFLSIPWDTVVALYREDLGRQRFDSFDGYHAHLLRFLESHPAFDAERQRDFVRQDVGGFLVFLRQKLEAAKGRKDARRAVTDVIARVRRSLALLPRMSHLPPGHGRAVAHLYAPVIDETLSGVLGDVPLGARQKSAICELCREILERSLFAPDASSVVLAGFGDRDVFPSAAAVTVEGVVAGRLRYQTNLQTAVTAEHDACILPLGQTEAMETFLEGVRPRFLLHIGKSVRKALETYEQAVVRNFGLQDAPPNDIEGILGAARDEMLGNLMETLEKKRREENVEPMLGALGLMSGEELALVADDLVRLSALRERLSLERETVGGPIDVAVITKCDGFRWVRSKARAAGRPRARPERDPLSVRLHPASSVAPPDQGAGLPEVA